MSLAHTHAVQSLYRRALKQILSFAWQRPIFYEEAEKLRAEFEKNRHVEPVVGARLVELGEKQLWKEAHCDPYIVPYRPGGSLYARNPPFPPGGMKQQLDFGREDHH